MFLSKITIVLFAIVSQFTLAAAGPEIDRSFLDEVKNAFVSGAPAARNPENPQLQLELSDLIKVKARAPRDLQRAQVVGYALSLNYLREKRPQEAIWALDKANLFGHGEYLSQALKDFLKSGPTDRHSKIGEGVSGSYKIEMGPHSAVAKLRSSDRVVNDPSHQAAIETFAHEFDRYIGLGRVSTTILRNFQGEEASVQYMLREARRSNIRHPHGPGLEYAEDVWVFDYLLQNSDRHGGNSLLTPEKYFVLIDQGRSFYYERSRMNNEVVNIPLANVVDQDLLRNIHDLPIDDLRNRFSPLIGQVLVDKLVGRIQNIRAGLPRPAGDSLRRRGWELGNLKGLPAGGRFNENLEKPIQGRQEQPALPIPAQARVNIDLNQNLAWFEKQLDIGRGGDANGKNRAVQDVIRALNDPNLLPAILHQFADRKRLAHFVEEHVQSLNPQVLRDYVIAANKFNNNDGRGIDRAVKSCNAAVKRKGA